MSIPNALTIPNLSLILKMLENKGCLMNLMCQLFGEKYYSINSLCNMASLFFLV